MKDLHTLFETFVPASDTPITIVGTDAGETINGDDAANGINALGGDDIVNGAGGNDQILGGAGNDQLNGASGRDLLIGQAGNDTMNGGLDFDTVSYEQSAEGVNVNLVTGAALGGASTGTDTLVSIEGVIGSNSNDTLIGNDHSNVLVGGGGDDFLNGGIGNDILSGGAGTDTLIGDRGVDYIEGGAGADIINGDNFNTPNAEGDYALYSLSSTGVSIDLGVGTASGGDASGDTLINIENVVGSYYQDTLIGSAGANELVGLVGQDVLRGEGGNDTLIGGAGLDTLTGGIGDDTFAFTNGEAKGDHITDFTTGGTDDSIALSGYDGISSFADLAGHLFQIGDDTLVKLDADDSFLLEDTQVASLTQDDFTFVDDFSSV